MAKITPMGLRNNKKRFDDEKYLFLILKAIEYPRKSKSVFQFADMRDEVEDKIGPDRLFRWCRSISTEYNVLPKNFMSGPKQRPNVFFTFDDVSKYMSDRKHLSYDKNYPHLNFKMIFGGKTKERIHQDLYKYIQLFICGELQSAGKRYVSYKTHKDRFFDAVKKYVDIPNKTIPLKKDDFGKEFRFIECALALEKENYLRFSDIHIKYKKYQIRATVKKRLVHQVRGIDMNIKEAGEKISLPAGIVWEDITIAFINKQEVEVKVKEKKVDTYGYKDFDCINKKNGEPDKQWGLLVDLSIARGEIDPSMKCTTRNDRDSLRQRKMLLTKRLRKFFDLKDDPFYETKDHGIYKTRFSLELETVLRGDGELYDKKGDKFSDLKEYHNSQTGEM